MQIHIRKIPGSDIEQEFYLVSEVDAAVKEKDENIESLVCSNAENEIAIQVRKEQIATLTARLRRHGDIETDAEEAALKTEPEVKGCEFVENIKKRKGE